MQTDFEHECYLLRKHIFITWKKDFELISINYVYIFNHIQEEK